MIRRVVIAVCALVASGGVMYGQNTPRETPDFEQKVLVDDRIRPFRATIQKYVDPEKAYNNLPLSSKTTFDGMARALLSTKLTDESGGKLGSAIQIIDRLDTKHGEVPGAKDDQQFRIYVQLKPAAVDVLDKSRESASNSTTHLGVLGDGTSGTWVRLNPPFGGGPSAPEPDPCPL